MNIQQLNEQLMEARVQAAAQDRLARELERVEQSLAAERGKLDALNAAFRKEDADVRRLESTSLVGLFYAVMGSKGERLEQERAELLSAKLKYDHGQARVTQLGRDVNDLRARLAGRSSLARRYEAMLAEKERLLVQSPGESALRLIETSERLADARAQDRELREAVQAGEAARQGLKHVVETLESASGWGTWDLLGGGMLASAVKHSRLDEAHQAVRAVQPRLQRFERELADVKGQTGLDVEMSGLMAFADIFVDGLLVDLLVQSRINESLDSARGVYQRVCELISRLSQQAEKNQRHAQSLESERRALLEQTG